MESRRSPDRRAGPIGITDKSGVLNALHGRLSTIFHLPGVRNIDFVQLVAE